MALKFFKQRDIDEMDASNIPDSFINYFESLSQERKDEIINSRPDLAAALGYSVINPDKDIEDEVSADEIIVDSSEDVETMEDTLRNDMDEAEDTEEDIFAQIKVNRYENEDLDQFFVDGAYPLEVLTIPDKTAAGW